MRLTLTARGLIAELEKLPPDTPVFALTDNDWVHGVFLDPEYEWPYQPDPNHEGRFVGPAAIIE